MQGFDADDFDMGFDALIAAPMPAIRPRAANGDQDRVDVRDVFEDFQAHRALAGDNVEVVEAGDVGELAFVGEGRGVLAGGVVGITEDDDVGAEAAAVGDFDDGGQTGA